MLVLLAFDKFKDSLTAASAGRVVAEVLRECHPDWTVESAPLTDGGEGFAEILTADRGGTMSTVEVEGPRGEVVRAAFGRVDLSGLEPGLRELLEVPEEGSLAIVEMAQGSGLQLLPPERRDLWQTGTRGTGQLLLAAARTGARAILLGIGGSATNDLGAGALQALGVEFLDGTGRPIGPVVPGRWAEVASLRGRANPLPPLRIACDVRNPLLGPEGATAVYGPQKGLRAEDLPRLEAAMGRMGDLLCRHFGRSPEALREPASGAAGGIGCGLRLALPDTRYVPGFPLVRRWLRLEEKIARADLIITGEGRFDRSSLQGKGPGEFLACAPARRVLVLAGSLAPDLPPWPPGVAGRAITPAGWPLPEALRQAPALLARAAREALAERFA